MLVTIVTYNPDEEFVRSMILKIKSKSIQYKVLIIDNYSRRPIEKLKIADYFIQFDKNYGLGRAYNYAIKIAKETGQNYIMFFDQDTIILDNFDAIRVVKEAEGLQNREVKPYMLSVNIENASVESELPNSNFYIAKMIVNSGMILNTEFAEKNLFLEGLFLDRLDLEYSYRYRKLGILPLVYKEKMLDHRPGEGLKLYSKKCPKFFASILHKIYVLRHKDARYAKNAFYYTHYNNFLRYYLMLRNDIYLWIRRKIYFNFWKIIIGDMIPLCETLGYKNGLKWIFRAVKHGLVGDLDKDNELLFMSTTN